MLSRYDPEITPDPAQWLELDEQFRIDLAQKHHRAARLKLPNVTLHAALHVVVENQIAEGLPCTVRAMARLLKGGLSRHDAVHAVASVVATHLFTALKEPDASFAAVVQQHYIAAVERLTVESWRAT